MAALLVVGALSSLVALAPAVAAGADQVGNLSAQAKNISEELVQEQLQAGAYQQAYSVASERVVADQRAIALTQAQIKSDRVLITKKLHQVRRLAVASYILNGSVSPSSGISLFAENVGTVQSANEYATISIGNLNQSVDQLHTAQRAEQSDQQALVRQSARDQTEQTLEASSLNNATATVQHMEAVQAQVTGQLAAAVAQANAAQDRMAVAAVATAQLTAVQKSSGGGAVVAPSPSSAPTPSPTATTTDPALPPFLQCVVQAESGGNYQAVSPNGVYRGAFQFSQSTWNFAAQAAGRPDLIGIPPNEASKADQDTLAVALYALDGDRPWLGDRCSS